MSLVDRVKQTGAKILTLDIERMKGTAQVEFWDLGDFKNRRIHADDVLEFPRTICVAWKFLDGPIQFAAEWEPGKAKAMLRKVWTAVDQADIVVGHNVRGFDMKHLNSGWRDLGLPPPSPYKVVDTLTVARQQFGDESRTLKAMTARLGLSERKGDGDHYDVEVARAACAGDTKAQHRIRKYCQGDVVSTEALYRRLAGWMPGHPHDKYGTIDDRMTCNQCWGDNLKRAGTKLAQQITYVMWRCQDCGANVQGVRHNRAALTRGAR